MLHLCVGQMFGGKSAKLIDYTTMFKDKKYKVFYPASCNKEDGYVYSRDRDRKVKAIKIFDINDLYNNIEDCEVVLLDEYTFYCSDSHISEFMKFLEYCDIKDIDVYLFGLTLDYLSRPFDISEHILPYADDVITLQAICDECGAKATRQIRYVNGVLDTYEDNDVLQMESGNIVYKPVCRKCFRKITGLPAIR